MPVGLYADVHVPGPVIFQLRLRQRRPIPLEIPLSATAPDEPPPPSGSHDSSRRFTKPWHLDLPRPLMAAAWERIKHLDIPGVPADRHFGLSGPAFYLSPTGDDAAEVQPILPQPASRVPHPLWPDRRGLVRWPLRRRRRRQEAGIRLAQLLRPDPRGSTVFNDDDVPEVDDRLLLKLHPPSQGLETVARRVWDGHLLIEARLPES